MQAIGTPILLHPSIEKVPPGFAEPSHQTAPRSNDRELEVPHLVGVVALCLRNVQTSLGKGNHGTEALHTENEAVGIKAVVLPEEDLLGEVATDVEKTAVDQTSLGPEDLGHQDTSGDSLLRPTDDLVPLEATTMAIITAIMDLIIGPAQGIPFNQHPNSPQLLIPQGATR